MNQFPFRQIHLDFHTSPDIPDVGAEFDPSAFVSTLKEARVNSVTCFARCHHGHLYYDSKRFPERMHPQLKNRNLLKEQIRACRENGIRVPIYTTVQWDAFTAKEHPEWLSVDETGAYVGKPFPVGTPAFQAGFYRALCVNSPYRSFLFESTKEILETFAPVDGLFFDIVFVNDCACNNCVGRMRAEGLNPASRTQRLRFASDTLDLFMKELTAFVHEFQPGCPVFYNRSHIGPSVRPVLNAYTHFELESLPSGNWGYWHFPVTARFARTLNREVVGMTGKFHTEWGDFSSFKNKAALEYETFRMLALGAKCSIGDQLEPSGRLSKASYALIGSVYAQVEQAEDWCKEAQPLADIGIVSNEEENEPGDTQTSAGVLGAVKMLTQLGHQFDILDSSSDFTPYKLLVLPDQIPATPGLPAKLSAYLAQGGHILASFEAGMNKNRTAFELNEIPVEVSEQATLDEQGVPVRGRLFKNFDYADFLLPGESIGKGMPLCEHVMYSKGVEARAVPGAEVLAQTRLPYFNRTYAHYCSHKETPSSGRYGYDAIVALDRVIYFSHPVFMLYETYAPLWCKTLVRNAIERMLPSPLLQHDGPGSVFAALCEQKHLNRLVAHFLHYMPERLCQSIDTIEDVIPLYDLRVSLRADRDVQRVCLVPQGNVLQFACHGNRVEFTVPAVHGHQMVEIQYAGIVE